MSLLFVKATNLGTTNQDFIDPNGGSLSFDNNSIAGIRGRPGGGIDEVQFQSNDLNVFRSTQNTRFFGRGTGAHQMPQFSATATSGRAQILFEAWVGEPAENGTINWTKYDNTDTN